MEEKKKNQWSQMYKYMVALDIFDKAIVSNLKSYYQRAIDRVAEFYDEEQKEKLRSCGYNIA